MGKLPLGVSLEKEADIKAVEYLTKSNINPENFANFLFRLGENESTSMKYFSWASTHPDSKERAEYIINRIDNETKYSTPILCLSTWYELKNNLNKSRKPSP
jgi:predicted Zn-dependent protease